MDCLRCHVPLEYKGTDQIQLGRTGFFLGTLPNLLSGALNVAVFECPNCGKIEFFDPEKADVPDDVQESSLSDDTAK